MAPSTLKPPSRESRQLLASVIENALESFGTSVKFVINYRFKEEHGLEPSDIADRPDLFASTIDMFFGSQAPTVRARIAFEIGRAIETLDANSEVVKVLNGIGNQFFAPKSAVSEPDKESALETNSRFDFGDSGKLVIREPKFFLILQESILTGMKKVLGEDGVQSTFYHLELARSVERPAKFHKILQSMYRTGTVLLEKAILSELYNRVHVPFREKKGFGYSEYVSEAFRAFMTREMESVAVIEPMITSN